MRERLQALRKTATAMNVVALILVIWGIAVAIIAIISMVSENDEYDYTFGDYVSEASAHFGIFTIAAAVLFVGSTLVRSHLLPYYRDNESDSEFRVG